MKKVVKDLGAFEQIHGQGKISRLTKQLAVEQAKVAAIADVQGKVRVERSRDNRVRFGLIGDTHIGSLYFNAPAFSGLMEYFNAEGVSNVYHAGDVLDGHRMYKGQEFELAEIGQESQVKRLGKVDTCGVTIQFITGNHDASFKALAGTNVGKDISSASPYWRFLGEEQATVRFEAPNGAYNLRLIHPGGGTAYALSYKPQKIIESIGGGEKPNMIAIGHFHKAEFLPSYRNVSAVQVGTTQKQTPFMARQGVAAHVGGWIIDVTVGDMHNVVRAEFVAFYG